MSITSLDTAIVELINDTDIDNYLRCMFWQKCKQLSQSYQDRRRIFSLLKDELSDAFDRWKANFNQSVTIQDRWSQKLQNLKENSITRDEYYDMDTSYNVFLITFWIQYRHHQNILIDETLSIKDDLDNNREKCLITEFWRCVCEDGAEDGLTIREYEDRFEEEIWHDDWDGHLVLSKKTIDKRNLFREEYHTIPFKPIHEELLYSIDVLTWFQNEAKRAEQDFNSMA